MSTLRLEQDDPLLFTFEAMVIEHGDRDARSIAARSISSPAGRWLIESRSCRTCRSTNRVGCTM